jgi:molybdate transport system ATP-binding protein
LRFLERVRDEVAVPMVYVSHNLPEVARLTGEAVVLRDGKVTATGTFADLAMDGPLAQRSDLVNALRVEVVSEDRESGTVEFALLGAPDVRIVSPQRGQDACRSTVFVRPSDVALALAPVTGISIRNQLPGRVRRLVVEGACARVEIDVGQPLVVELTRASAQLLGLEAGSSVVCLIKSRAVTR